MRTEREKMLAGELYDALGAAALILPGVRIGARAVIGAGSVVTRDVPENVFAAGNPYRVIRAIEE